MYLWDNNQINPDDESFYKTAAGVLQKDHGYEIQKAGRLDKQKLKKPDNQIQQKMKKSSDLKKKKAVIFCEW